MRTAAMRIAKLDAGRRSNDDGQTLVEYALIIALVSLAAIAALGFLSGRIQNVFSKSGNSLNAVQVASGGGSPPPPPPAPPPGGTQWPFPGVTASGGIDDNGPLPNDIWITSIYQCTANSGLNCATWSSVSLPQGGGVFGIGTGPCSFSLTNGYIFSGNWQGPPIGFPLSLFGFNTASNGSGTSYVAGCF